MYNVLKLFINNNVHLSCAHQCPECSHHAYYLTQFPNKANDFSVGALTFAVYLSPL